MIHVFGANGRVKDMERLISKLSDISSDRKVVIQVMDADMVYSKNHVISAVHHAIRAFRNGTNSTRRLSMEIMLYAAGERQIGNAIRKMGIKEDSERLVFVFVSSLPDIGEASGRLDDNEARRIIADLGFELDDGVIYGNKETLRKFGISDMEIRTVSKDKYEDLILEKVAMVDIIK
ncbi:MAG TPA: hypothetical protein ENG74_03125 [Thermoplasmatales archaeon]|nr:hypothetical protein [Thermoplasmatales archaeon]